MIYSNLYERKGGHRLVTAETKTGLLDNDFSVHHPLDNVRRERKRSVAPLCVVIALEVDVVGATVSETLGFKHPNDFVLMSTGAPEPHHDELNRPFDPQISEVELRRQFPFHRREIRHQEIHSTRTTVLDEERLEMITSVEDSHATSLFYIAPI